MFLALLGEPCSEFSLPEHCSDPALPGGGSDLVRRTLGHWPLWALPLGIAPLLAGQSNLLAGFAHCAQSLAQFCFRALPGGFSQRSRYAFMRTRWPVLDRKPSRPEISSGYRDQARDIVHSSTAWHSKVAWRTWRGVPGLLSLY